ncbi:MAG: hypothetical protein KC414_12790 [Romboutsia sp.]|nr:hypothetical protein [Romboutsia sp.]
MNYKPLVIKKFLEFKDEASEFSFGELLYSILRNPISGIVPEGTSISWLKNIEDSDFYTVIDRALEEEKDYKKQDNGN